MAKTKRLTKEQCKPLFDIMYAHTRKAISEVLNYCSEHEDYDPGEVKIFIKNHFEMSALMTEPIINNIAKARIIELTEEVANKIDFPNSSSENKSSNTNYESEV